MPRGIVRPTSRASSAMFEIVSMPVYATMPTGIAIRKSDTVGAVPKSIWSTSSSGSSTSTTPTITSSTCVTKSVTAKKTFTPADSLTPTMFRAPSRTTTRMPPTMSAGDSPSGSQKTPR